MEDDPAPPTGRRARRPVVVAIALASAASLVTGLGWTATRGDPPTAAADAGAAGTGAGAAAPDAQVITATLANRARAVRARDGRAFMATVVSAPAAFQAAQRQAFDNLTRLPLETWQERLESAVPVATGPRSATVKITLAYRLRGFDRGEVVRTRYLTFTGRAGDPGWVITGDGAAHGLRSEAEIWDGGPLTVVRGRHSLVIGSPANGLREIAGRLDAAVPAVTDVVGHGWARRAVAVVPAADEQAAALAGQGSGLRDIAALATVAPGAPGPPGQPGAPGRGEDRIVVSPTTFAKLNELGRGVVLTHELTHVATGGARDGRTPLWLIEGLADYVGYKGTKVTVRSAARELSREVRAGRLPARLPGRADFDGGSARMPQVYEEAWLACRMIADRYGQAALISLYRAAGRRSEASALHEVLGLTPAELTALWHAYLKKELQ